eukprot:GSMAST32.ASY1.ANO1.566.1 assembled CDS
MLQIEINDLCCPITLDIYKDPVVAADGHTYERAAILRHFQTKNTSPLTNEVLPNRNLVPNLHCKSLCVAWKEKQARMKSDSVAKAKKRIFQAVYYRCKCW